MMYRSHYGRFSTGHFHTRRRRNIYFDGYLGRNPVIIPTRFRRFEDENRTAVKDASQEQKTDTLCVKHVSLKVRDNTRAHRTDEFDITEPQIYNSVGRLVVRRGQPFSLDLEFNRPYDEKKDDLKIIFSIGKEPKPTNGTFVQLILSDKDEPKKWGAFIKSQKGNNVTVTIATPPECLVGKWSLKIDVIKAEEEQTSVFRWENKDPIYILFNPWCKDDGVFMPDEHLLKEYILNDIGIIYVGNCKKISARPWVFGQFTGDVLDCCMYLLDKCGIKDHVRGDPIVVSRKMSAIVNSNDDRGVLTGNWTGDYSGGTSPLQWTGSVAILESYYKTKSPVEFGQCWVFSGVMTTVCRALGIPARSVTNFESAHDTDGSITIDCHFDCKGNPLDGMDTDSVWNFHVWNDVWMARPDLPAGYGGWQAVDATPQEHSDGVFCMGPVSLAAIKSGDVGLQYDGPFAFAEVNADKVLWMVNDDGSSNLIKVVNYSTGVSLSTKAPLKNVREDITDQYKFPEGSEEERIAVRRANQQSSSKKHVYQTTAQDVVFDLVVDNNVFIGDEIRVNLNVKNTSADTRRINGTITIATVYYTGIHFRDVFKEPIDCLVLKPHENKTLTFKVPVSVYQSSLVDHCLFKVSCLAICHETKQTFVEIEDLRLRKPHLTIKAPKQAKVGQSLAVEVSFVNPLPCNLSSSELRIEGPGLQKPTVLQQQEVKPQKTFVASFQMTPAKTGDREVVVYFNSEQISAVSGSHIVHVVQ